MEINVLLIFNIPYAALTTNTINNECVQVIALYVTGALNAVLSPQHQTEIIRYMYNHQVNIFNSKKGKMELRLIYIKIKNEGRSDVIHVDRCILYNACMQNEDGGWGLHVEGHSTVFGSTLQYVALRLLGEGTEDGEDMAMARARQWILHHGGAIGIPSWGKFWITVFFHPFYTYIFS